MAHYESIAVGGYFPLPPAVIPHIVSLIDTRPALAHKRTIGKQSYYGGYNIFDPCAGKGEAITQIVNGLFPEAKSADITTAPTVRVYGNELEQGRATALKKTLSDCTPHAFAYHADAFTLSSEHKFTSSRKMQLIMLNPPYHPDKHYGRLEHRFLTRFTEFLEPGKGIMVYVVPHYALSPSVEFLHKNYSNISCFRFPDEQFPIYKQVVLIAQRRKKGVTVLDPDILARIRQWAVDTDCLPKIDAPIRPCITLPPNDAAEVTLSIQEMDTAHLQKQYVPFHQGQSGNLKPVPGMGIQPLEEILGAVYPVVLPPKPAHIALALASGLFNGFEVCPDETESPFPPIVVKGIYTKVAKKTEEKTDKDGNVVKRLYVEQPKLEVVVLNLRTHAYHMLNPGITPSGATLLSAFNIADLLAHYGKNLTLMMQEKCPPLHDPTNPETQLTLPKYGYTPFPAQSQIIQANLKMLFTDRAPFTDNPFILGEVGTGKTFMSAAILGALTEHTFPTIREQLKNMGIQDGKVTTIRSALIVCPPHLVHGWQEQLEEILPGATIHILSRVSHVVSVAQQNQSASPHPTGLPGDGLTICILSREMGKLGHAWESVKGQSGCCPHCGEPISFASKALVKERICCQATTFSPTNEAAVYSQLLAHALAPALPDRDLLLQLVNGRFFHKYLAVLQKRYARLDTITTGNPLRHQAAALLWQEKGAPHTQPLAKTAVGQLGAWIQARLITLCQKERYAAEAFVEEVVLPYLMIFSHPERDNMIATLIQKVFHLDGFQTVKREHGAAESVRSALSAAIFLIEDGTRQEKAFTWVSEKLLPTAANKLKATQEKLQAQRAGKEWNPSTYRDTHRLTVENGQLSYQVGWDGPRYDYATPQAAFHLLKRLLEDAEYKESTPCGSPLYTAVPKPRRYPLATLIAKRYPQLVDFLIIDEAHENANGDSAQAQAAHRLEQLGVPTLHLTGTNSNGYASSMFANLWVASANFRHAFNREDLPRFVDTYGYRKLSEDVDHDNTVVKVGVQSDRQASGTSLYLRKIGQAPGILPLFIFKYLLPIATMIQKDDLNADLPPLEEIAVPIELEGGDAQAMLRQLEGMQQALTDTILSHRGTPLAGKLWGAYAQLPSYLDRAHLDTGNECLEDGRRRFSVRYPASEGGAIIKAATPYPADVLMPKETWLIDKVKAELALGNACLVFVWNTGSGLADRLNRILTNAFGKDVALLDPKVKAVKRQAWIQKHVIDKKKRVLICNPKAVETGLNNLTWFNRDIWFQNPNANAILFRQANGRIHRIGQKSNSVKAYVPYYAGTTQEAMFNLLALKIQAAVQIDGVDIESALVTAGASTDETPGLDGLSIGKALYEMMQKGGRQEMVHFQQEEIQSLFKPSKPKVVEPVFAF